MLGVQPVITHTSLFCLGQTGKDMPNSIFVSHLFGTFCGAEIASLYISGLYTVMVLVYLGFPVSSSIRSVIYP